MCHPTLSNTAYPTARKPHKCIECDALISTGDKYELVEGLWEGEWRRFKTCLNCSAVREALDTEDVYFGGLIENLMEADAIVRKNSGDYESLEGWLIVSNSPLRVRLSEKLTKKRNHAVSHRS